MGITGAAKTAKGKDGGRRLFFRGAGGAIQEVEVVYTAKGPEFGAPVKLFDPIAAGVMMDGFYLYDVSGEGKRFLAVRDAVVQSSAPGIVIVQNWFAEFRERN